MFNILLTYSQWIMKQVESVCILELDIHESENYLKIFIYYMCIRNKVFDYIYYLILNFE